MTNWDDLRLFLEVSRSPRLQDAAARLGQDATTVSRRLRRLEKELRLTLFERTRRGHVLTPAGENLARRAESMELAAFDIASFSEAGSGRMAGRVRLGVTEGLGGAFIAPAMAVFSRTHPEVFVDLIALSGFVSLSKREADMSVMLARPKTGRLKVRKLTDYTLGLYAAPAYLQARTAPRRPADLKAHTLIGYVDDLIYSPQLRYFEEVLPGLAPQLCSSSILAQREMARAGAGVAMLPRFMAEGDPSLAAVLEGAITVERSFWLAVHEDVSDLARIRAMADFLTDLMAANRTRLVRANSPPSPNTLKPEAGKRPEPKQRSGRTPRQPHE